MHKHLLDVFRVDESGGPLWINFAETMEEAKDMVRILAAGKPGDFIILDHMTQEKIVIKKGEPV